MTARIGAKRRAMLAACLIITACGTAAPLAADTLGEPPFGTVARWTCVGPGNAFWEMRFEAQANGRYVEHGRNSNGTTRFVKEPWMRLTTVAHEGAFGGNDFSMSRQSGTLEGLAALEVGTRFEARYAQTHEAWGDGHWDYAVEVIARRMEETRIAGRQRVTIVRETRRSPKWGYESVFTSHYAPALSLRTVIIYADANGTEECHLHTIDGAERVMTPSETRLSPGPNLSAAR